MILLYICIFFFLMYSFTMFNYWLAWKEIPVFTPSQKQPSVKVSVIIPARNEEQDIGQLLQALQEQSYPKELFEVIVVDDHSTDATADIVQQFSTVKLIQLKEDDINSYKKKAIKT